MLQWKPWRDDKDLQKSIKHFPSSKLIPLDDAMSGKKEHYSPNPHYKYLDLSSREQLDGMSLANSPDISLQEEL